MTHRTLFPGVHASSVGTGIANAIFAVADEPDGPESWVHFCITAAEEAHASVLQNPPYAPEGTAGRTLRKLSGVDDREPLTGEALTAAARLAASTAFRCCMPKLTNRRSIQAFIACAMVGQLRGYLTGKDSNALLYGAQQALAAYPKRASRKGKK